MGLGVRLAPVGRGHGVQGHQGLVAGQASPAASTAVARGQQPQDVQLDGYLNVEAAFQCSDGGQPRDGAECGAGVGGVVLEPADDAVLGVGDFPYGDRGGSTIGRLHLGLIRLRVLRVRGGFDGGGQVHVPDLEPVGLADVADGQGGTVLEQGAVDHHREDAGQTRGRTRVRVGAPCAPNGGRWASHSRALALHRQCEAADALRAAARGMSIGP